MAMVKALCRCTQQCLWIVLLTLSAGFLLITLLCVLGGLGNRHCEHIGSPVTKQTSASPKPPPTTLHHQVQHLSKDVDQQCSYPAWKSNPFSEKVCEIEAFASFYSPEPKPLVVAKDISLTRYYAQRDLQGWMLAYKNMSFNVIEQSFRTQVKLSDLSVFLCLGIHTQDRHCIKPSTYRTLTHGQKINQIHGLRDTLWRKDAFCYTIREALTSYKGRRNFTFPCWILPKDSDLLRKEMTKDMDWIVKPSAKGEGHGIFIVSSYEELQSQPTDGFVVQPLLADPFLVDGKKFDFRTYVLVTSVAPLRAYIYKEGLIRFASSKYSSNATKQRKEQQLLTNTSVGKKYTQLSNLTWTFKKLKLYLTKIGVDAERVFESLYDSIVRSLLSAEYRFLRDFRQNLGGYDCRNCFQLLGVDVILDSHLNPIVIEVNGLPSMQLSHDLGVPPDPTNPYTITKFGLMHDMLQILFKPTSVAEGLREDLQMLNVGIKPGNLCRLEKHSFCVDYKELQNLLDSKREFINRGGYKRIYPSVNGQLYSELIFHMHGLIRKRFNLPVRTLWQTHHLYTALERLYSHL